MTLEAEGTVFVLGATSLDVVCVENENSDWLVKPPDETVANAEVCVCGMEAETAGSVC